MTDGGNLKKDFSNLFAINSSSPYDLIATMTNDTAPYCGTYECQEFDGGHNAEKATASVASKHRIHYCDIVGYTIRLLSLTAKYENIKDYNDKIQ